MTIDKGKFYKTVGWITVTIGLYLVGLGTRFDDVAEHVGPRRYGDDIIDAEFTIIDD